MCIRLSRYECATDHADVTVLQDVRPVHRRHHHPPHLARRQIHEQRPQGPQPLRVLGVRHGVGGVEDEVCEFVLTYPADDILMVSQVSFAGSAAVDFAAVQICIVSESHLQRGVPSAVGQGAR